jgi:hypothetical protein
MTASIRHDTRQKELRRSVQLGIIDDGTLTTLLAVPDSGVGYDDDIWEAIHTLHAGRATNARGYTIAGQPVGVNRWWPHDTTSDTPDTATAVLRLITGVAHHLYNARDNAQELADELDRRIRCSNVHGDNTPVTIRTWGTAQLGCWDRVGHIEQLVLGHTPPTDITVHARDDTYWAAYIAELTVTTAQLPLFAGTYTVEPGGAATGHTALFLTLASELAADTRPRRNDPHHAAALADLWDVSGRLAGGGPATAAS